MIRSVNDFPNYNKIFKGGKMEERKTVIYICKNCPFNAGDICELVVSNELIPQHCPFMIDWKANWKEKK